MTNLAKSILGYFLLLVVIIPLMIVVAPFAFLYEAIWPAKEKDEGAE